MKSSQWLPISGKLFLGFIIEGNMLRAVCWVLEKPTASEDGKNPQNLDSIESFQLGSDIKWRVFGLIPKLT